jgi:hypothetical protein
MLSRADILEQRWGTHADTVETIETLVEWLYDVTRTCQTCPHGTGRPGAMCDVDVGSRRPCFVSDQDASEWLEGGGDENC